MPKGAAALPHRPDGRVQASSEDATDAVLKQLGTSQRHMEVQARGLRMPVMSHAKPELQMGHAVGMCWGF